MNLHAIAPRIRTDWLWACSNLLKFNGNYYQFRILDEKLQYAYAGRWMDFTNPDDWQNYHRHIPTEFELERAREAFVG